MWGNSPHRLVEMIIAQKETVGLNGGLAGKVITGTGTGPPKDTRPTLAEAGIDKKLSSRSQKLALHCAHQGIGVNAIHGFKMKPVMQSS